MNITATKRGDAPDEQTHGGDETEWAPDLQGLRAFPILAPLSPAQRRHLGIA